LDLKTEHILTTKRGKIYIVIEQFKYTESNILQNETIRFRCTNKKCKVSVLIDSHLKNILEMTIHKHNHEPSTKRSLAIDIIRSSSKKKLLNKHVKNLIKLLGKNY